MKVEWQGQLCLKKTYGHQSVAKVLRKALPTSEFCSQIRLTYTKQPKQFTEFNSRA